MAWPGQWDGSWPTPLESQYSTPQVYFVHREGTWSRSISLPTLVQLRLEYTQVQPLCALTLYLIYTVWSPRPMRMLTFICGDTTGKWVLNLRCWWQKSQNSDGFVLFLKIQIACTLITRCWNQLNVHGTDIRLRICGTNLKKSKQKIVRQISHLSYIAQT